MPSQAGLRQLLLQLRRQQQRRPRSRARLHPPRRSPCTESLGLRPPPHLQVRLHSCEPSCCSHADGTASWSPVHCPCKPGLHTGSSSSCTAAPLATMPCVRAGAPAAQHGADALPQGSNGLPSSAEPSGSSPSHMPPGGLQTLHSGSLSMELPCTGAAMSYCKLVWSCKSSSCSCRATYGCGMAGQL